MKAQGRNARLTHPTLMKTGKNREKGFVRKTTLRVALGGGQSPPPEKEMIGGDFSWMWERKRFSPQRLPETLKKRKMLGGQSGPEGPSSEKLHCTNDKYF